MRTGLRNTLASRVPWWLLMTMLFWTMPPGSAWAALGGDMESVDEDQSAMNASEQIVASSDSYTVYELRAAPGTVVREYLSLDGKVFAVTWKGPTPPDLRRILGGYFKQYSESATKQRGDHSHLTVRNPDLVVESGGHMRAFFGRAYLPHLMPPEVAPSDIK
jgi:hypothetical protein